MLTTTRFTIPIAIVYFAYFSPKIMYLPTVPGPRVPYIQSHEHDTDAEVCALASRMQGTGREKGRTGNYNVVSGSV